jgi:hypothetical protein
MTRPSMSLTLAMTAGLLLAACTQDGADPTAAALGPSVNAGSDGDHPITARANLNVTLRGNGHGRIKFRQPRDAFFIVFLNTKVRGLTPNTNYQLQRATDDVVDDNCTGVNWLTLGRLSEPLVIHTNGRGKGEALFTRDLSGVAGGQFDIHFRVIDAVTSAVVLQSGCYQFKVRQ